MSHSIQLGAVVHPASPGLNQCDTAPVGSDWRKDVDGAARCDAASVSVWREDLDNAADLHLVLAPPLNTIGDLKRRLSRMTGILVHEQVILFSGHQLADPIRISSEDLRFVARNGGLSLRRKSQKCGCKRLFSRGHRSLSIFISRMIEQERALAFNTPPPPPPNAPQSTHQSSNDDYDSSSDLDELEPYPNTVPPLESELESGDNPASTSSISPLSDTNEPDVEGRLNEIDTTEEDLCMSLFEDIEFQTITDTLGSSSGTVIDTAAAAPFGNVSFAGCGVDDSLAILPSELDAVHSDDDDDERLDESSMHAHDLSAVEDSSCGALKRSWNQIDEESSSSCDEGDIDDDDSEFGDELFYGVGGLESVAGVYLNEDSAIEFEAHLAVRATQSSESVAKTLAAAAVAVVSSGSGGLASGSAKEDIDADYAENSYSRKKMRHTI
ncbi:hypothetical protein HDU78_007983 [Chytriomyces hyalinus]|nr:hypothetical protein HDU78_007983 [Chytriomyces hyalinus]KAJ3253027.1 hypothetical protein HDU77_004760 [Chytriomyces hyalinus]